METKDQDQEKPLRRNFGRDTTTNKMEGNRAAPASSSWLTSWNLYKWFKDEHQRRVEAETKLRDEKHRSENDKKQLLETKKQELQDEKTRREEAEKQVENLRKELQTKVDRLTADVQKLKGEKEKSEKQLKKELETKNKKDNSSSSSLS